jgi:hypothetical protein
LPANATHPLVEAVKRSGATPRFATLDRNLGLVGEPDVRVAWSQPPLGMAAERAHTSGITILDHGDSVPHSLSSIGSPERADVTIFGLHLSSDRSVSGILMVFRSAELLDLYRREASEITPTLYRRAAAQLQRLQPIAQRQEDALDAVARGLQSAAGLPFVCGTEGVALAHGIAFQLPAEASPSTFWAYVSAENTSVQWLPILRPVYYAAASALHETAASLERWFLVPVSPYNSEEQIRQSVLGVVKAAEYLGLRWRTDPALAAEYAVLMTAKYGKNHDAYRPAFPVDRAAQARWTSDDVSELACQI